MAGTNDAIMKTSENILVELLHLKSFVEDTLPACTVVILCPTYRYEDPKTCLTIVHLLRKLNNLQKVVRANQKPYVTRVKESHNEEVIFRK